MRGADKSTVLTTSADPCVPASLCGAVERSTLPVVFAMRAVEDRASDDGLSLVGRQLQTRYQVQPV
jgi:hypothetical protein